jgi:putative FmdB family regulatory protein
MPLYEYKCRQCGFRFEALLSISRRDEEEKDLTCPECDAKKPERLISAFATGGSSSFSCPDAPSCSPGG